MTINRQLINSLALTLLILFAGFVGWADEGTEGGSLLDTVIATGPEGSIYAEIGKMASQLSQNSNVNVRDSITNGSQQNLRMLDSGKVRFALTQQDALVEHLRHDSESTIQVIKPIFEEYLHILVRSQFNIQRASQFRDLRIFPGLPGSGTKSTTQGLFNTLGISSGQYTHREDVSLDEVEGLFRADELDVATYVDGLGNDLVKDLMRARVAHLYSLDHDARKQITIGRSKDKRTGIYIRSIPARTYANQSSDIHAISVPVLLVTTRNEDSALVSGVVTLINAATAELENRDSSDYSGLFSRFQSTQSLDNFSIYGNGIYMPPPSTFFTPINIVLAVAFVTLIILSFRFRLRLFRFFRSHPARGLGVIAIMLALACSYGAYLAEHEINAAFSNFFESVYSVVIYIVSGMENRVPVTGVGRLFCLSALVLGPLMIALITGLFASSFIIHFMEAGMPKQLSDHFVIANWNSRALAVIEQLRSPILEHSVIAVVSDDPGIDFKELNRQFQKRRSEGFEDVYFCPGDPGAKMSLLNANVEKSDAIIVLADDREQSSDEKTLRTVFVLKEIAEDNDVELDVVVEL
ncbi:MAG: hypothetical protein OEV80_14930, partial [candidate division Zixibacteria bacterium]|nr:hypothetical protein [candidate division Zixibacteria bacterium]